MKTHDLKCWPVYFEAMLAGKKNFDVRVNDRHFEEGDFLRLNEFDPEQDAYTGRELIGRVTYILTGGRFGIPKTHCVMALDFDVEAAFRRSL